MKTNKNGSQLQGTVRALYSSSELQILAWLELLILSSKKVSFEPNLNGSLSVSRTGNTRQTRRRLRNGSQYVPLSHDPPWCISEVKCLQHIMQCVERAHICPGNPQPEFVEIVNKRGGSSAGSKVAFVDSEVEVKDLDGCVYGCNLVPRPSPAPVFDRLQYFCILQAIKNWSRGRPENEAIWTDSAKN